MPERSERNGYNNDLFGDYDSNIGIYNYNRHTTAKLERIGKKYQWIAMYNILARITDHYEMRDRFSQTDEIQKYEGPWEPYVRDFDASLNELFMCDDNMPVFEDIIKDKETFSEKTERELNLNQESVWIKEYPIFFDCQKKELVIKDTMGIEWVALAKYADSNILNNKLQIWNWIYGYFVTESQYDKLKYFANKKINLLNSDITWIPETYTVYCREYPWAKGCADFKSLSYKSISIRTGKKKVVEEIRSVPEFSKLDDWLNMYISKEEIEIDEKGNIEETDLIHFPEIAMKEEIISREIDVEEDIGEIICASVNFLWEEEYDASKNEAISWYAPCAEIIEEMKLQYGKCDGAFYDENGAIAAFDTSVTNQQIGIVIRKDLLDAFLTKKDYRLVWFVKASKEIHVTDHSIGKYSDWTGLYSYEEDKIIGKLYMCNDFED
ncbi:MAG: hypothetical protein NC489_37705 [Ruminococcus flavefaciens]|nr:hypothetical protein [Ruminococcus flavefaciens]